MRELCRNTVACLFLENTTHGPWLLLAGDVAPHPSVPWPEVEGSERVKRAAAELIQRVGRGMVGRRRVRWERIEARLRRERVEAEAAREAEEARRAREAKAAEETRRAQEEEAREAERRRVEEEAEREAELRRRSEEEAARARAEREAAEARAREEAEAAAARAREEAEAAAAGAREEAEAAATRAREEAEAQAAAEAAREAEAMDGIVRGSGVVDGTPVRVVLKIEARVKVKVEAAEGEKNEEAGVSVTVEDVRNLGRTATRRFGVGQLGLPAELLEVPVREPEAACAAVLKKLTLFYSKKEGVMTLGMRGGGRKN